MTDYICNLVLPGAAKSGTSTLHILLDQHPLVAMSSHKEPQFFSFDDNYTRGPAFHNALFDTAAGQKVFGESSQSYMVDQTARSRIAQDVPGAKIIFVLRHPVERAWSQYRASFNYQWETRDFSTAVAERGESTQYYFEDRIGMHREEGGYLAFSRYSRWIPEWQATFGAENVLLIDSRTLFADPAGTAAQCFAFLGLPPLDDLAAVHANRSDGRLPPPKKAVSAVASLVPARLKDTKLYHMLRTRLGRSLAVKLPATMPPALETQMRVRLADEIRFFEDTFR